MRNIYIIIILLFSAVMGKSQTLISPSVLCNLNEEVNETSGLVNVDGEIWTLNDSGGADRLYQIDIESGDIIRNVKIDDADNDDWEDLASDDNYVYIGDFGNNYGDRTDLKIYRINKSELIINDEVTAEKIEFSYSDQTSWEPNHNNHDFDCEAMICHLGNIYLFTKNWVDHQTRVYVLPNQPGTYTAQYLNTFNANCLITGAELLPGSNTLLLIGYDSNGGTSTWMFNNFIGDSFFSGDINLFFWSVLTQVEGICIDENYSVYISSEEFQNVVDPILYHFDFSDYIIAIPDIVSSDILIFNSQGKIQIQSANKETISAKITICDLLGQTLGSYSMNNEQQFSIDVNFPSGLYFIIMESNQLRTVKKIRL